MPGWQGKEAQAQEVNTAIRGLLTERPSPITGDKIILRCAEGKRDFLLLTGLLGSLHKALKGRQGKQGRGEAK